MREKLNATEIEALAHALIENCCIEGTRNSGGRYTRVYDDEAKLLRRVAAIIRRTLDDLATSKGDTCE